MVIDTHVEVIHIHDTGFVNDLTKFELEHNWKIKTMQVSVLYVTGTETSMQQIFGNQPPNDSRLWKFLDSIGTRITMRNWNKFRGDLDRESDQPSYFTEWRGREIMFHIAPWFNSEQHRRLIGNDIVHILFYDNETQPLNTNVIQMGTVPHIFAVVRPNGPKYNLGFFYRETIYGYKPSPPPRNFDFDGDEYFRDYLLTRLHNGVCVTKLVPPMNKLFVRPKEQAIIDIGEKWMKSHETQTNNDTTPRKNENQTNNTSPLKLVIVCVSGQNLIPKDSNGLSDPFVVVRLLSQKIKTSVIERSLNPEWNETFEFDLTGVDVNSELSFTVYDKDPVGHDYMGDYLLLVKDALDLKGQTKTFVLQSHKTGKKVSGTLTISFNTISQ